MQYLATLGQHLCLGKIIGAGAAARIEQKLQLLEQVIYQLGTIHLRRQHVLGGRVVPMCRWSKGHSTEGSKIPFISILLECR